MIPDSDPQHRLQYNEIDGNKDLITEIYIIKLHEKMISMKDSNA